MRQALAIVGLTGLLWQVAAVNASGIDIPLTVTNREAIARTAEPVTAGVPFAQGVVPDAGRLRLLKSGVEIPAQFLVTARWPDGSVRWVLVDFQTDLAASGSTSVTLQTGTAPSAVTGISVTEDPSTLSVNTQAATLTFIKSDLAIRESHFQVQSGGVTYQAMPNSWTIEEQGPMKLIVRVEGVWRSSGLPLANDLNRFRARLVFFRGRDEIRVYFTFRNNNSYGWGADDGGQPQQPDVILTGANVGPTSLLAAGGSYHVGSGVEKTWDIESRPSGGPALRVTRYAADGGLYPGDSAPRPIASASAAYYTSTLAWGRLGLPVSGLPPDRQADFDLFERIGRSMVDSTVVENPPGLVGETVWGHLSVDLTSWYDYGDLRWAGNGCGTLSSNHYDWAYGMYLQFMRTGRLAFADAAGVFARHEIDFDVYHTGADGTAYNYQKEWEDRASHDNPGNCFGGGRPSHTWSQGYALHWLLTGDRRGKDAFDEIQEGVRQYVYESFNGEGYIDTSEIRIQGWLVENLVNLWRINPSAVLSTTSHGAKTIADAIQDVIESVVDQERTAGAQGFVLDPGDPGGHLRQPLMHVYFLEPAIKAYGEVFADRDAAYASSLRGLIQRMTSWLISVTYGGDANAGGEYRPRQIPYQVDTRLAQQTDGQVSYLLMVANAAGFLYTNTGDPTWRDYARAAFQDYVRYLCAIAPDSYGDPSLRTPASYNSNFFPGTESKIHGWSNRYGQYFLAIETGSPPFAPLITWNNPAAITYGTPLGAAQLNATANVPGVFVFSPPAGTVLAVGTQTLSTTFTPADTTNYTTATDTVTIVVLSQSTLTAVPAALRFGAVKAAGSAALSCQTPAQSVTVTFSGATGSWTVSTPQAWLSITGGSGSAAGTFTVGIQNPSDVIGASTALSGTVTITSATASNSPLSIPVTLTVLRPGASALPFGAFDTPATGATGLQGSFAVTGWALDDVGIDRVELWRDPVAGESTPPYYGPGQPGHGKIFIANPLFVSGSRPDIESGYPTYPFSTRGGWGYMLLSWGLWAQGNGPYTLYAFAYDQDGHSTLLGTKAITVDNAHATKPFGAIDTPSYGGTVSGSFWNFGWALTPNATPTCTIMNGSVQMNIDSGPFVTVNYGDLRTDIAAAFPGFSNGNNSGGAYYVNSTALTNGVHTIGWLVYDNCSRGDGVGSRFFTVLNSSGDGADPPPPEPSAVGRPEAQPVGSAGRLHQPNRNPVGLRQQGEDWQWVWPNEDGWCVVEVGRTGRIEVQLPQSASGHYTGYQEVNGQRRDLPLGSSFDANAGIFYWQPAPGFLGAFNLVFEAPGSGAVRVQVVVK